MDAIINLLEKRIEALELQVLPNDKTSLSSNNQTITDLLLQTQTMITSALSCREAITSILQLTGRINDYLDPTGWSSNELEVNAKRHFLLELYPEIKDMIHTIHNIETMVPFMDSVNITRVAESADKLQQLASSNLTMYDENREVTFRVLKSLQQYNDITSSLKILFAQIDKAVSDLENALQPQFVMEE